jgi:hypothetical protein
MPFVFLFSFSKKKRTTELDSCFFELLLITLWLPAGNKVVCKVHVYDVDGNEQRVELYTNWK